MKPYEEQITKKVHEFLDIGEEVEVLPDTDLTKLGADSLDMVELVMEIEEEFDVTLPEEEVDQYRTVGAIAAYVEKEKG